MPEIELKSHAKVNLYLRTGNRRKDGYREICTVLHEISLHDRIRICENGKNGDTIECGVEGVPEDGDNLVLKAVRLVRQRYPGLPRYHVVLEKMIPPGAGLAGGSSNAVAVLIKMLGLARAEGDLRREALELAAELGSDTCFFVFGDTALCRGRGEIVKPTFHPRYAFNLVLPPFGCATGKVFSRVGDGTIDPTETMKIKQSLEKGELFVPVNDLTEACLAAYPELRRMRENLTEKSGVHLHLSGSGSTLFSLHRDAEDRDEAFEKLKGVLEDGMRLIRAESR